MARGRVDSSPLRAAVSLAIALALQAPGVERELTGAEGWAGVMAHPAVLNPPCGYPAGTILNLGGEWEFKGLTGDVTANRKPSHSFYSSPNWNYKWLRPGELPLRAIRVPGCWEAQGVGESGVSEPWIMIDNQRMPLRHKYMGEGWYRRWVEIPAAWKGCRIWLKLGGLRGEAHVWVNDNRVALVNDYCATRKFEVTPFVVPGQKAKVVIELDNRAATSSGCLVGRNRWGGILRSPELEATPQWLIDDVWARGDFDRREAEIRVWTARPAEKADDGVARKVRVSIEGVGDEQPLSVASDGQLLRVPLAAFRPWSPKYPNLYTARVDLVEGGRVVQTRFERFGVRKLETVGSEIRLNGEPFFVRGFGDDAVYPIIGTTIGDRDFHRSHLAKARAAGFNQVRLHSHCELQEYFDAADELGILVQPELPYYNDCCTEYGVYDPLRHLRELHENYRNHPSLAIYGMGNEGSHGKWMDRALYRLAKTIDPDRLAISQSGHFEGNTPDIADFDETHQLEWEGKRGEGVDRTRPFTIHEYLNLSIRSDYRDEKDYVGVWLPPETLERRKAFMAKSGLGMEWGERLQDAQISLQRFWQKDGVEGARLDTDCDGFCFWTIVDVVVYNARSSTYSAQGLFDPFWRSKRGGFAPEDFAVFNSPSCVLLSIAATNRVYASGERLLGDMLFAHYEHAPVEDARVEWRLTAEGGCVLAEGSRDIERQNVGPARKVASLDMDVPAVKDPCRVWLSATVCGNAAGRPFAQSNRWSFWFFPTNGVAGDIRAEAQAKGVAVAREDSPEAAAALREGRPAVIVGKAEKVPNVKLGWWWMGSQMGFAVRPDAPLDGFPHDGTLSPLWFRIVGEGQNMTLHKLPEQDAVIVGEGGEACYCYLALTPLPKGGSVVRTWGLDVLANLPEARFLLHALVSAAAPKSVSPDRQETSKKLSPEERIRQIAPGAGEAISIVLPAKPTISETFAAQELKYHLEKATGKSIPVVAEASAEGEGRRLYVGNVKALAAAGIDYGQLDAEERIVKGVGRDVYMAGGELPNFDHTVKSERFRQSYALAGGGTLYAVYDFLERDMGVKWIWPGELGEVIPKRDIPNMDGVSRRGQEPLLKRALRGNLESMRRITVANRLWGWKDAQNAHREVERRELWLTRNRMGCRRPFMFGHAFTGWHKRFADHPEYFAMQPSGRRGSFANLKPGHIANKYYPLCVSNPKVHAVIVNDWARRIKGIRPDEKPPYINCCENDSPGFCTCAGCRAWDAADPRFAVHPYWNGTIKDVQSNNRSIMAREQWGEDGAAIPNTDPPSVTDRYVRFYNAVLEKARAVHPLAEVCAYAYSNYRLPPKEARIADGIVISFVPGIIFPYARPQSDEFRTNWVGWNGHGATQMLYRPNYMFGGGSMPYSQARRMAADINFAFAHGMIAIDQDSLLGAWSAQAMKNYVAARILREPDAPYEKMAGEFCSAFGAAADDIDRYCDRLEALNDRFTADEWARIGKENPTKSGFPGGSWKNFVLGVADLYSEEWFARSDAILAAAEAKVTGDAQARVGFLRKGLRDGLLTYRTRVAQKSGNDQAFKTAFKTLIDYRASVEADNVCAWAWFADSEDTHAGWPHKTQRYR